MDYANLGSTGLKVSRICLGAMTYGSKSWRPWVLDEEESQPFYRAAFEAGINFFDSADVYSLGVSEEILGRAVKKFGPSRDKVVLATKVYSPMGDDPNQKGLSRKHILHSIDESLRRLGTDYVDLYQIHRFDQHTPIEETMEALHDVVRAGKALYLGASSMYAWQFSKMLQAADTHHWTRFVTMQNHYNLLYREEEREMNPLCKAEGVGLIPWSPLARGVLAGNRKTGTLRAQTDDFGKQVYGKEISQADTQVIDQVAQIAEKRGVSSAEIALAWLLHKPGVVAPIIGASKPGHLEAALGALKVKLEPTEIEALQKPYIPHPIAGHE